MIIWVDLFGQTLNLKKMFPNLWVLTFHIRFSMGARNSAYQFSKAGLSLSTLPSTQKSGALPTKFGIIDKRGLHSLAIYHIFLFKIGISTPKWPLSGLKKHNIIAWKNFLWRIIHTDLLFCVYLTICFDH